MPSGLLTNQTRELSLPPPLSGKVDTDNMQHWSGQYSFDKRLELLLPNGLKTVDFELSFRLKLFGFITGEIRDGAEGVPELATVRGRLKPEASIRFKKTYPNTWAPDRETQQLYVFENRKQVVYYKGIFENPARVVGAWEIHSQRRVVAGMEYAIPHLTGSWNATRS